jgi:transporter family protein
MWILAASLSAVFAGATAILAKSGIKKTDSDLATAIRTVVVLVFSWVMVLLVGSIETIVEIEAKSIVFLVLSGLATGMSWICYFKALSMANVNKVVPIDKSSTILTILLAIIIFQETNNLWLKIIGVVMIGGGIFLMIEKKDVQTGTDRKGWFIYAILAAVFAALTSVLAKIGIEGVESNLATAIRTSVVLVMAWIIVFARKKQSSIKAIEKREMLFICLSGIATGLSWLCYYYAIQNGIVSVVVPIDKLSILITILFSYLFLKEKIKSKALIGLLLMVLGTLVMIVFA